MLGDLLDVGLRGTLLRAEPQGQAGRGRWERGEPDVVQLKVKSEPRNVPEKPLTLGTSLGLKARGESKAQVNSPREAPHVSPASGAES